MTKLIKLFKKQGINFNQIQPSKKEFILKIIKDLDHMQIMKLRNKKKKGENCF